MLPEQLENKLQIVGNESGIKTRQTGNIEIQFRKNHVQKNIFYQGVKMYNALPSGISQCRRLKQFEEDVKRIYSNVN